MKIKGIAFNRQELAGSVGDLGTDFPLIVAMIVAADLHTPSVLIVFGLMQVFTGIVYKMPMPVQPLKAMAALVIAQKIAGNILLGAGLSIGVVMLLLALTGALRVLAHVVPKAVIRGIQAGLGISLCSVAFKEYIPAEGLPGFGLALAAFVIAIIFMDHRRYPAALLVILAGFLYAVSFKIQISDFYNAFGLNLPKLTTPSVENIATGFILLALPQIPLSLGNSILATYQIIQDYYPQRSGITVTKIGLTYALLNLTAPFLSGIPCCHGSGGMVGHYTFGGRTGGSVILYGLFYIFIGLFFVNGFDTIIKVFPLPVLGVILLFEGFSLVLLLRDMAAVPRNFVIAVLTAIIAFGVPYGFVVALIIGMILFYLPLHYTTLTGNTSTQSNEKETQTHK